MAQEARELVQRLQRPADRRRSSACPQRRGSNTVPSRRPSPACSRRRPSEASLATPSSSATCPTTSRRRTLGSVSQAQPQAHEENVACARARACLACVCCWSGRSWPSVLTTRSTPTEPLPRSSRSGQVCTPAHRRSPQQESRHGHHPIQAGIACHDSLQEVQRHSHGRKWVNELLIPVQVCAGEVQERASSLHERIFT